MTATPQFEHIAVRRDGCVVRAHSTDWDRAKDAYNALPFKNLLYAVLWKTYDHTDSDPIIVKEYHRR